MVYAYPQLLAIADNEAPMQRSRLARCCTLAALWLAGLIGAGIVSARTAEVCPGPPLPPAGCFTIDTTTIGGRAFGDYVITSPGKLLIDTARRRAELATFDPAVAGRYCAVNPLVLEAGTLPTVSFADASARLYESRWTENGVVHVREYAQVAFDNLRSSDGVAYPKFGLTFNREQNDPVLRLEFIPGADPNLVGIAGLNGDVYLNVNTVTGENKFQRPDDLPAPLRRLILALAYRLSSVLSAVTNTVVVPGAIDPLWNLQGVAQAATTFSDLGFGTPLPTFAPIVTFTCNLQDVPGTVTGCVEDVPLNQFRDFMIRYGADYIARGEPAVATAIVSNLRSWAQANALSVFPGIAPGQINQPDFRPKYNLMLVLVPMVHTWSLVRQDPVVTVADRALIDGWFARVIAYATEPNGGPQNPENPFNVGYLVRGLKMAWGTVVGNNVAVAEGMEKVLMGLNQMRSDGSFPREVARGACALKYQDTMLLNLMFIAELAATQGYDAYALAVDGKSLHTAVKFLLDGVDNPAVVLPYASQDPTNCANELPLPTIGLSTVVEVGQYGFNYSAWLEPYIARFPDHPNSARLRNLISGGLATKRPLSHPHSGGNTTCFVAAEKVRAVFATPVSVIEFYNASLDHYFITWAGDEIAKLDAGTVIKGWTRTGKSFPAYASPQTGTSAVCRIYIPPGKGDGHYFGRDTVECNTTMARNPNFILESASFFHLSLPTAGICPADLVPVYRVFSNRADANHRYTTDRAVRDQMVAAGWLAEGDGTDAVVMCAPR